MSEEVTWVALMDVHRQYGFKSMGSARNAVAAGRFPVPTYKLGGMIVIDKEVHAEFFRRHREAGLQALRNNKSVDEHQGGDDA